MSTERLARLEARVAELEDERALRQLLARFSFLEDAGREEEWVALWTEDGVYDLVAAVSGVETVSRVVGHDQLRQLMADPAGNRRPEFYRHCLHTHAATVRVLIEGDSAMAHGYTVLHQETAGVVTPVSAAANHWTFRRVGGEWMVAGRVRRQIGTDGFSDALAGV